MKIAVLGAGSFGCAIAEVLASNKHDVTLWTHLEEEAKSLSETMENPFIKGAKIDHRISITSDLNIINECMMVVFVVPSFALRPVSKQINEILTGAKTFVVCTKGLEANTMKSGHTIIQEEIAKENIKGLAILSGPTHAEELAFKKYTSIVSTSDDQYTRELVQTTFNNSYLRVYTNSDVQGVEILGAAKNVLAIAAGMCDSHPDLGDNAKAALLTRGLRELRIIGDYENCNPETFYGLTGLGDLIVTATSKHSRNRKFGELLGTGISKDEAIKVVGMVVEGVYSVQAIHELKEKYNLDLPIIEGIYQVLFNGEDINVMIASEFDRPLGSED